jgi:hypothetical protein
MFKFIVSLFVFTLFTINCSLNAAEIYSSVTITPASSSSSTTTGSSIPDINANPVTP